MPGQAVHKKVKFIHGNYDTYYNYRNVGKQHSVRKTYEGAEGRTIRHKTGLRPLFSSPPRLHGLTDRADRQGAGRTPACGFYGVNGSRESAAWTSAATAAPSPSRSPGPPLFLVSALIVRSFSPLLV